MENRNYDVIIIGAGIIGSMIARFLSRYELQILLVEKESDICMGTTAANTAIIHAGYDPLPGTLKAEVNIKGNKMWDTIASELNIPFERRGDYVVAIGEGELPELSNLMDRGKQNGVPGLMLVSGDEMRRREPDINPEVSGALWAQTGGIADPFAANFAAAENAVMNGAKLMLDTAFEDFIIEGRKIVGIKTNRGEFYSRWVINAAGLYSDEVMHKAGVRNDFVITPRKGEYIVFDKADIAVNNVLFPVPNEISKGIMVTTTTHGNTIIGPNAKNIRDKEDRSVTDEGLSEIWQGALKLIPKLNLRYSIALFAGLRAGGNARSKNPNIDYANDYVIEIPDEVEGFVNLGGIESPGLAASPAIAQMVVDLLKDRGEALKEKPAFNPIRPARPRFRELSVDEQKILIQNDSRYGRIVCRCENVTEGEIIAEIHSPIPATTYDAIKRRTWLGTGRCQGSFDTPRVVDILSRELG
ncbi:MAG: NAD(P)/FAD-dependent oxidoreductase, partial [Caldisericaceae bacterium]